jgi:hypothetical protein
MTGLYPKRGKYELVNFYEKCDSFVFDRTLYNYPSCYCGKHKKYCFIAWKKCTKNSKGGK